MSIQLFRRHSKAILEKISSGVQLPSSRHLQKRFNQSDLFRAFAIRCPVNSIDDEAIQKLVTFRSSIGIKDKYICGQCPFQKECKLAFNKLGEDSNTNFDVNLLTYYFQKLSKLDDNTYNSILSARTSQYNSPQEDRSDKHFIYWGSSLRILDTLEQLETDVSDNNGELTQLFINQNELYQVTAQEASDNKPQISDDIVTKKSNKDVPVRKYDKNNPQFDEKKAYPNKETKEYNSQRKDDNLQSKMYQKKPPQDNTDESFQQREQKPRNDRYESQNQQNNPTAPQRRNLSEDDVEEKIQYQNKRDYQPSQNKRDFESSNSRSLENRSRNYDNDRGYGDRSQNYNNRSNDRSNERPNYRSNDRSNDRGQGSFQQNRGFDNQSTNYRSNSRSQDNYQNNRNYESRPNRNYENNRGNNRGFEDNRNSDNNRGFDNNRENRFSNRNYENSTPRGYDKRDQSSNFGQKRDQDRQFGQDSGRKRGRFDEQASLQEELKDYEKVDSFESRRQSKRGSEMDFNAQDRSKNKFSKYGGGDQDANSDLSDNSFESFQKEQQSNLKNESYTKRVAPSDRMARDNETSNPSTERPESQRTGGRNVRQGKFKVPNSE